MPEAIAIANPASIQIALVEDDPRFQSAVASAIRQTDDMQLLWVADTLAQALRALNGGGPAADVLLVDLGLPDGSGIEAIATAARRWPGCAVMVSTAFGDEAHVLQSIEAGASGYLLKDSMPERIVGEIRSLHAGGSPISPLIARQVLMRFKQASASVSGAGVAADRPDTVATAIARPWPPCPRVNARCCSTSPRVSRQKRLRGRWMYRTTPCSPSCGAPTPSSRCAPRPRRSTRHVRGV